MLNTLKIPKQLRQKIDKELQPHEVIRWIGQPHTEASSLIGCSLVISLLGLALTALSVFFIFTALEYKIPNLAEGFQDRYSYALYCVPVVAVGLFLLLSPFWIWDATFNEVYIITDKRAISFLGIRTTEIRSYAPEQLANVYSRQNIDGTGDVVIGVQLWRNLDGDEFKEGIGFFRILNCKEAETLIKELAQTAL